MAVVVAEHRTKPSVAGASRPFTLGHFRAWAARLELDNGERWRLEPFQSRFVGDLFRRFPVSWLVVPEGNGKTTLIAGLALYHIEFTASGYVAVAASTRDQAEWIYRQAAGFVARNDMRFKCLEGYRRIRFDAMDSRIQVFAADDRGGDGAIASLFILDELHRHKDLALYQTWSGKLGKRGGQLVAISTAGEAGSEFEQERERFRRSSSVTRRGSFVRAVAEDAVLHDWALVEDADPGDLRAVEAANPFSGITLESLRRKRELPGMTAQHWARFTCNRASRAVSSAVQEAEWFAAGTDEPIPEGEPVWAGLDLGWNWDTTALVPLWVRDLGWRQFGPARILEHPGDGAQLDAHLVERAILELHDRNPLLGVVMDPHQGQQLAQWIEEEVGVEVVQRGQTRPFQVLDYARFMEALRYGWLHHSNDPGLTRHVLNAIARMLPGGEMVFDRPAEARKVSASQRRLRVVDALDAAAMVHTTACAVAEPAGVVYA